jgi:hypothetical protein
MGRLIELLLISVSWAVPWWFTAEYFVLKKRVAGLDKPELWLPKKERQAHARRLLQREDEQYLEKVYRQMVDRPNQLKGGMDDK